jgi:hypothetical protein
LLSNGLWAEAPQLAARHVPPLQAHRIPLPLPPITRAQVRICQRMNVALVSTPFEDRAYYTNIRKALVAGYFMQVRAAVLGPCRPRAAQLAQHPENQLPVEPAGSIDVAWVCRTCSCLRSRAPPCRR